ncbi:MAG: 3-hydroxyacyl-CoA dehydrogenase [Candidatus Marinimicrobia bacterium]|nr:3-hydroxyacyl-CoA dehydrogenase [Candidatus Neomarinimicrobiota bacterium]
MSMEIKKVAVLGTGVMGSQIAAHLTNAGIEVFAFDMTQEVASEGIENCKKLKPSPYYNFKSSNLITVCNYSDHLDKIKECNWVVEVISEKLEWKQDLYKKIIPFLNDDCVVTSNTSGISLQNLSKGLPDDFLNKFFITHFFNPPRYMKLVEIISSDKTNMKLVEMMDYFLTDILGKNVVHAKDTPNFIANRIGVYGMMVTLHESKKRKLSIEDVDALTGTLIGRPKSATFRTADVVGLDTMCFVADTAYNDCQDDPERDIFKLPDYIQKMVDNNWLGQKTKQGFYKKIDKGVIHSLDLDSMDYKPMNKKKYAAFSIAKENIYLSDRLNSVVRVDDLAGEFLWTCFAKSLAYSANLLGEIADDVLSIDNAMKGGFGWELGPFEVLDAIGLEYFVERCSKENIKLPDWLKEMPKNNFKSIYKYKSGKKHLFDTKVNDYIQIIQNDRVIDYNHLKSNKMLIDKHWSASLYDLGDGVASIKLHSVLKPELNPIDGSMMQVFAKSIDWVKENNYKGLVISGEGANFCAGANLSLILQAAEKKDFESLETFINTIQQIFQNIRFADYPVVGAPYGLVLGGGMEIIGSCDRRVAAAESYIGLVEVGVGLIPGAGGNLRMLSNLSKKIKTGITGTLPLVQKAFETVGFAKVATSAKQAQSYGYLTGDDKIVVNRDHILSHAKDMVLDLSNDYSKPEVETFKLPGSAGRLAIDVQAKSMVKAGKISEHDALIGSKLAYVLTGGKKGGMFTAVDEQYLLDIEREAFLSLCGEKKTLDRIKFMLTKGKPLRN